MIERSSGYVVSGDPGISAPASSSVRDRLAPEWPPRGWRLPRPLPGGCVGFPRGPLRAPAAVRIRVSVFAVGRRVYVACGGDRSAGVTLTDDSGTRPLASLGDGTEVAILAWRPAWAGTTRYRVRATASGLEGWLPVGNLRSTEAVISPAPTAAARRPAPVRAGESGEAGRRSVQHPG